MRGTIPPAHNWDVMVDLFFYREPQQEEDEAPPAQHFAIDFNQTVPAPAPQLAVPTA